MNEQAPIKKPEAEPNPETGAQTEEMEGMESLVEARFDDFAIVLEELNEEPLEQEAVQRLKEDFIKGRWKGFQVYEKDSIAGIAIVVDSYSAVHARKVLQLDELFVRSQFRSRGLGKKLFDGVIEYAKKEGYMRLEWRTEKNSIIAQDLYSQYETDTSSIYYLMEL